MVQQKGPCSPKTGQKVVFIEGEKGFSKNPVSKGIPDPKTGLKRAKGLSGPTLQYLHISVRPSLLPRWLFFLGFPFHFSNIWDFFFSSLLIEKMSIKTTQIFLFCHIHHLWNHWSMQFVIQREPSWTLYCSLSRSFIIKDNTVFKFYSSILASNLSFKSICGEGMCFARCRRRGYTNRNGEGFQICFHLFNEITVAVSNIQKHFLSPSNCSFLLSASSSSCISISFFL